MSNSIFLSKRNTFVSKRLQFQQKEEKRFANKNHKDSRLLQALSETAVSFCNQTSLHGVKNVVDDLHELGASYSSQQRITKLISLTIWATACIMGIVFAIVLMGLVWDRFQTTPTITTVETNNFPIWNVPFPAVTICNLNKVYSPATENITNKLMEKGILKPRIDEFLSNLSKLITPEYMDDLFEDTQTILTDLGYTPERIMYELMQPCNKLLENCTWLGKFVPCDTLFRVAKSSEGFCCSFNYKALKDSLEIGANNETILELIDDPAYHVSGAGQYVGLDLLLKVSATNYISYTKSFYGIPILIHAPQDYPEASVATTIGQPGCDLQIAVIPSVVVSEPSIRGLSQTQRNCYFDDEKKLRTTTKYSFQSCITECAVDTILNKCNCLPFYYAEIHLRGYGGKLRQCGFQDVKCLRDNRHIFSSLQPPTLTNETIGMDCSFCLPSCSEERYAVQTIVARRFPEDKVRAVHFSDAFNLSNYVTLKIHFKDISCIKYRRDVFMTWDGLFASFGGIFGLCLGGSVISLVELVYFLTYKLYHNYKNPKTRMKPKSFKQINVKSVQQQKMLNKKLENTMEISISDNLFSSDYEKKDFVKKS